jgi:LytS/YehU family sensor histidine kinase
VSLRAEWTGAGIRFEIENPYDPEAPAVRAGGIGLRNVRDRLSAKYGSAASLSIEPEIGRYRVTLRIPVGGKV